MKDRIELINHSIEEKENQIKERAERKFESIFIPCTTTKPVIGGQSQGKTPPISYILYGIAGLVVIGTIFSKEKLLCLGETATWKKILCFGISAACAYGGYRTSKMNKSVNSMTNGMYSNDIDSIKTDVTSKVIDVVNRTVKEWEVFMELKQKEVRLAIDDSSYSDSQKDEMKSKIYLYEIIDIKLSDFQSMTKDTDDAEGLKSQVSAYKSKLIKAIGEAATKQIAKYSSILDVVS